MWILFVSRRKVMQLWQQVRDLQQKIDLLESQMEQVLILLQKIQTAVVPLPAVKAVLTLRGDKGQILMQLKDNQVGSYAVQIEDAAGNAAPLESGAVPAWSISDPSIAALTPSADGLSCQVQPSGKLGSAVVQFSVPAVGDEPAIQAQDNLVIVASVATQAILVGTPG